MSGISFKNTPNPSPNGQNTVTWEVTSSDTPIVWTVSHPAPHVVRLRPIGPDKLKCDITALGLGMATITASVPRGISSAGSVSRDIAITTLFAYPYINKSNDPNNRPSHAAPSDLWTVVDPIPTGFLSLKDMGNNGMAYVADSQELIFNSTYMGTLHSTNDTTTIYYDYTTTAASGEVYSAIGVAVNHTYVYAPDGTLWALNYEDWFKTTGTKMPTHKDMVENKAALAWAPPQGFNGSGTVGQARTGLDNDPDDASNSGVTCFILDQSQLTAAKSGTTYYKFTPKPPKP